MGRKRRQKASVSVDLDNLGCYYRAYGIDGPRPEDLVYKLGIPRYLDLFAELGVRATLFVVARDLEKPQNLEIILRARDEGHEIASHSFDHPVRFRSLPRDEKERQVAAAENKISEAVGNRPAGFRAPGWDIDEETLGILADRGYLYDSSIIPTLAVPALKLVHWIKGGGRKGTTSGGKNTAAFAPNRPYRPDPHRMWKRGESPVVEIPFTATPLLRLPFYASWHLAFRFVTLGPDYRLLRLFRTPVNYGLHPIEMIDCSEADFSPLLNAQPGFTIPWREKRRKIGNLLAKMKEDYEIVTLEEVAKREMEK